MNTAYENKANPGSLMYRTDKNLTEEQREKFKADLRKLHEGANYAPGTLTILPVGVEVKKAEATSWPPKEHIVKRVTAEATT